MPNKITLETFITCDNIDKLYYNCFENKQCHEDNDRVIYHNDIKLSCAFIQQLYKMCKINSLD